MSNLNAAPDKVKMEHKKAQLGNMVGLMHLGGFIGEEIRDMVEEFYPKEVLNVACQYADIGQGFQKVLQETEKVYKKGKRTSLLNNYKEASAEEGAKEEISRKWMMEQTAKYTAKRETYRGLHKGSLDWEDWDLEDCDRSLLYQMNALEYRIFELGNGLGTDSKGKTAEEIAAMAEFNCDPALIQQVQRSIRSYFVGRPESYSAIREASKEGGIRLW